ncbi:coiled-coil domain-containing protein 169 [Melospiza georgiana]|uniref:coiled-coil domain-containing protein 169 n=1 Tax=Melospiza georgiana TaxID=44398 RepID=UPI0025ACEEC8|nr:coiled-coil domain-containing protein 169 [Melospiza georgiana]
MSPANSLCTSSPLTHGLFSPPYSKLTYSTPYEQLVCFCSLQLKSVVSSYEKEVIVSTRSAKPTEGEHKECKRQMLESSIFELRNTVTELEKSLNSTENEDNEWKTRYETQVEWNKQLERQINILRDKVELIRGNPADKLSLVRTFDKMPVGSLKEVLKQLEEEKKILQNQLKDYELRLEQEAKAYHKVNDERRFYLSEILQTSAKPKIFERNKPDALTGKGEKQILRVMFCNAANHSKIKLAPLKSLCIIHDTEEI